jgi:diguanylate cyclase (GGDEF)-like protein
VAQCVMAGFMGALWLQHRAHWRDEGSNGGAFWLMFWSGTLTVLFLVNGLLPALPSGLGAEVMLFLRAQILAAAVVLALPTAKSFTRGRPIRWWVTVAGALFVARAILWLSTDLVLVHSTVNGEPRFGSLEAVTFLAPVVVVALYVAVTAVRMPATAARSALMGAAMAGAAGLTVAFLIPPGHIAELVKGLWAMPLMVALYAMGKLRIRGADARVARQHALRDALTEIGNAACFTTDRLAILKLAETTAREQVGDGTLIGLMSPGTRGEFTATFESAAALPRDDLADDFLDDLGRVVSVAAERLRLADNLRDEALTDPLTRLPNRKALELHLAKAFGDAAQKGASLALLYCDIDDFKRENDKHGHAWGDELLLRIAAHLKGIAEGAFLARFGGDDFVVVIEEATSLDELVELARSIRVGLDLPGAGRIPPLLSVGVAVCAPEEGADPDLLLREGDAAMFEGRRSGLGVMVFDDALRTQLVGEQNLGREIDAALLYDDFVLHYQPIVDARSLGIVGVEALIRWPHWEGMRMPAEWIPFAEKTGAIIPVGRWVVVAARNCVERLGLPVAVNVAARQLADPQFIEHLREDWGDNDWHLLTLEITESDLLEDLSDVVDSLTAVRALGARISIDDFGTGYSSFSRLASLPVDVLKIDQAFVRDLDTQRGVAIVRAIVSLARAYGLDVVAEGVERIEQLEVLAELGVPHIQGYLLGRPSLSVPQRVELSVTSSAGAAGAAGSSGADGAGRVMAPATFVDRRSGRRPAEEIIDEAAVAGEVDRPEPALNGPHLEAHDQVSEQRDQAGEQRDQAGEQRDQAGEQRDQAGEQRDQAGEQRDQAGEQRDHLGEQRDHLGEQRDHLGEQRDHAADHRDEAADQRDRKAELDVTLLSTKSVEEALKDAAAARIEAASDRRWSALDRLAAAGERSLADLDRDSAMADRGAAAGERSHADFDRDEAMADRGAAAGERTYADFDRDNAMADRGASAKERGVASLDALTSVYRRGAGLVELQREIARARGTKRPFALAFVDVDRLKGINDSFGHAAGDQMLLEVASTLRAKLRNYDLIFRYGGDEFVCGLAGLNQADAALRMSLVNLALADAPGHGSVTVGVSELRADDSLESLVARADAALYLEREKQRAPLGL